MTDRVYPTGKPAAAPAPNAANPAFPATKAQLYNASRPAYRPQPPPRRRRGCCCCCFLWTTLLIASLLLAAAIAAAVFYVLYRPARPTFSVSSLQISQFNLSQSSRLTTNISLSIIARNPNKKLVFIYSPTSVAISAAGVPAGSGSFSGFTLPKKNTTNLRTKIASSSQVDDAGTLRSDLKNKKSFPLKIELNTKVRVKIGGMKTNRVRARVTCSGIKASAPTGKSPATAESSGAKCKVDLRVKIWKWTF